MKVFATTDRLILRELSYNDEQGMFALDSDPAVHVFLGDTPIATMEEARKNIEAIRQQYKDNGIGRWAMIERETGAFLGWSGLKYLKGPINGHVDFYELGYRMVRRYWGKGYAAEAAQAVLHYGFQTLHLSSIYGMAMDANHASRNVLEKSGLRFVEDFDLCGERHAWYVIERSN